MPTPLRVALLGFSEFESDTLASCLRLAANPVRRFERVLSLTACDFAVVDAGRPSAVQQVQDAQWVARTLFIGSKAPEGAGARLARPIDPAHVLRELDGLAVRLAEKDAAPDTTPAVLSTAPAMLAPRANRAALLKALVVDDSEIAQRFLASRLVRFPLLTERASSSQQALDRLARERFDVVFVDVELGDASHQDGLALCQLIKRTPTGGDTPIPAVVMVSAHHSELDRVRGSLAGCDAYLAKPLAEAELQTAMQHLGIRPLPTTA
jgi:CheY-like chemotaxis protein